MSEVLKNLGKLTDIDRGGNMTSDIFLKKFITKLQAFKKGYKTPSPVLFLFFYFMEDYATKQCWESGE